MLSELSEGKQLETWSTQAPSLYLNKSNVWDIFSSHEGSRRKKVTLLPRKWQLQTAIGITLFTVSNAPLSHRRFCFYADSFLCQGSPSLSGPIHIVTAIRQRPSLLCHVYPQWIITRPSQTPPSNCMHIPQVERLIFLSESIFLQAKSFTIFSLPPAICKCQRVTYKTVKWKGMRTETPPKQGAAACRLPILDQRGSPPCCLSA